MMESAVQQNRLEAQSADFFFFLLIWIDALSALVRIMVGLGFVLFRKFESRLSPHAHPAVRLVLGIDRSFLGSRWAHWGRALQH